MAGMSQSDLYDALAAQIRRREKIRYDGSGRRWVLDPKPSDSWPERFVVGVWPTENLWDSELDAVRALLDCGHEVFLTGEDMAIRRLRCRSCALYGRPRIGAGAGNGSA